VVCVRVCVCVCVCASVMVDVTAGQVFLGVRWFSFGLGSLMNGENRRRERARERGREKKRGGVERVNRESERASLMNDWRVMD